MEEGSDVLIIETTRMGVMPSGTASDSKAAPGDHRESSRADALDVLIEQERQLIVRFEARQSSADSTAAAAVTAALALAALAATGARTVSQIDKTFAWIVAGAFAAIPIIALGTRFLAGLRRSGWGVSSRSGPYKEAVEQLHQCGPVENLDPVQARECVLRVCRSRATDAEKAAESKEIWAALASGALAIAVALTAILAFVSLS